MISKKGFLFTISIILFATTLVFYAQVYSDNILKRDFYILDDYKASIIQFIMDDISYDILNIFEIDFENTFSEDFVFININGKLYDNDLISVINEYEGFLINKYFTKTLGQKTIDFSDVLNNGLKINLNNNEFVFDFYNSNIYLRKDFSFLDLNIFYNGNDLNHYVVNFDNSGTQKISVNIRYFDDVSVIILSEEINLDELSTITFVYDDYSSFVINIGEFENNYFMIDSNNVELNYFLGFKNNFDNDFFKASFNIPFEYETKRIKSNSLISVN